MSAPAKNQPPTTAKPAPNNKLADLPRHVTFEEYLQMYDSIEGARTEWVAGKVEVYPVSVSRRHAELLGFLHVLFMFFMAQRKPGKIYLSDFPMYMGDDYAAREPDLMIVFQENLGRVMTNYLDGPADLVVEIISPESGTRDRGQKFEEYEQFGVPEYWLIDPIRHEVRVYALSEEKIYHEVGLDTVGRVASVVLPGFILDPAVLWRDPLPFGGEILALVEAMG